MKSKTIEWLRFFCIGLIVLLHAVGMPLEGKDAISYQNGAFDTIRILFSEGICRVAVPIFFLVSGYLFFVKLEEWNTNIWIDKLKKRVKTLLIPYVLWNLITICFSLAMLYPKFILKGGEAPDLISWYDSIGGLRAFWDGRPGGYPHNYPLWFMRDLMVFIVLAPVVFQYVKRLKIVGLAILYIAYFLNFWIDLPGFSAEGLFFFALGAFFSINRIDFATFFKQHWIVATWVACPVLVFMFFSYGNNDEAWGYACRLFTVLGAASTIGIVASLFEKQRIKVHPLLSGCSFFVYAAHGRLVLPILLFALAKALPDNQIGLILSYFIAPLLTIVLLVLCYYFLRKWIPKTISVLTGGR